MTDRDAPAPGVCDDAVAVVGGGAAGLFAAGTISSLGRKAVVFERNPKTGMKLGITGKGRCNLTNSCTREELMAHVPTNP